MTKEEFKEMLHTLAKVSGAGISGWHEYQHISPLLEPVPDASGRVVDARIRYTLDFSEVILTYMRASLDYLLAN